MTAELVPGAGFTGPPAKPQITSLTPHRSYSLQEKRDLMLAFLDAYRTLGVIGPAAEAVGVPRPTLYEWRDHEPAFKEAWELAKEDVNDAYRAELRRRAVIGEPKPIYNRAGEHVDTLMQKDPILLMFDMKARMNEYRDKLAGDTNVQINITRGGPDLGV